jgi:hypothetical protein
MQFMGQMRILYHFTGTFENKVVQWGNSCILGGDFNTIQDNRIGYDNIDREGGGRILNKQNSRIINDWIEIGVFLDPFRALYPKVKEMSYMPFRARVTGRVDETPIGKSRLDLFLISPELLDSVDRVKYEDRLGSDFDHREVTLKLGHKGIGVKVTIHDSTLQDITAEDMVRMAVYENVANNLVTVDEGIRDNLIQFNILINEKEELCRRLQVDGNNVEVRQRLETNDRNMTVVRERLPTLIELLGREFICNYRTLYEGVIMGVKNVLMGIQRRKSNDEKVIREQLVKREEYIKTMFGEHSQQWFDAKEAILRFDDVQLKERVTKFWEFLDINNKKATKAFCRLSKEGGICDKISQIKGGDGEQFNSSKDRGNTYQGSTVIFTKNRWKI